MTLASAWQLALVFGIYGGNWTALFHHGADSKLPSSPVFQGSYVFATKYDGHEYRIVAHDPFFQRGFQMYLDDPVVRQRRILVPLLAYFCGFGSESRRDAAFIAWILAFTGLAVYYAALLVHRHNHHIPWGMLALCIPGVLSGVERCTIDVALIALVLAFSWYTVSGGRWQMYAVLALAPLARETGVVLAAACILFEVRRRDWKRVAWFASTLTPAAAWNCYVLWRATGSSTQHLSWMPMEELWSALLHPHGMQGVRSGAWIAALCYYLAVAGVFSAFYLVLRCLPRHAVTPAGFAMLGFMVLAIFSHAVGLWLSVYHFGRIMAPLLILLVVEGLRTKDPIYALPMLAIIPGAQLATLANVAQLAGRVWQR